MTTAISNAWARAFAARATPPAPRQARALVLAGLLLAALAGPVAVWAQAGVVTLDGLPRPSGPPLERGPVVPAQVESWRQEAKALEYGENGSPRDPVRAAELYCRAARHGDAEAQYSLAWMLTNSRGIERDEAQAAHLFAAAAEQGLVQARNILARMGAPRGAPPACLRPPDEDRALIAAAEAAAKPPRNSAPAPANMTLRPGASAGMTRPPPPPPRNAPDVLVRFVNLEAPEYQLEPYLVLAFIAAESNFDASAVSPKNAQGLMQLIPETGARFGVRNLLDPVQNMRGGMAYLRWLMARFQGDVVLVAAAYNAGEAAVERYLGVPPYAETRQYVWKIVSGAGGLVNHPFDASVTPVSAVMPLMRTPWRIK
ncbi:MAG: transglycosylase SLT domain-containing protein [Rubrivivax sp.]|jgi:soluble lytic murein transglycosylase-like protein|nr:transglycosylase SLT domain-containing protein [Rubrivivax sp.]